MSYWHRLRLDPIVKDRRVWKATWTVDPLCDDTMRVMTLWFEPGMPESDVTKLRHAIGIEQTRPLERTAVLYRLLVRSLPQQSGYWVLKRNPCVLF